MFFINPLELFSGIPVLFRFDSMRTVCWMRLKIHSVIHSELQGKPFPEKEITLPSQTINC